MKTIVIYSRGKSIYRHIKTDLDAFIQKANLAIQLNEISDINAISAQNPKGIPFLTMDDCEPIYMEQGEYVHAFSSRVKRWIVDSVGNGELTRILVPIDFSDASLNALRYAIKRHKGSHTIIDLVSAHIEVVNSINAIPVIDTHTLGILNDKMSKLVDELILDEENNNLIITGRILTGPIVQSILKESQQHENTVIYIGSSGISGMMKNIFGSVTRQLVKKTKVPLFIIPPAYDSSGMTNVAFAVSDPDKDAPLFKILHNLIGSYHPTLHLIHSRSDSYEFQFESYKDLAKDFHSHLIKTMLLKERDIATNIIKYINKNNFHLMVMSHYQRTIFESIFHKSISKQVASGIKCPILILNAETKK